MGEGGVHWAVAIAGHVQRTGHQLIVGLESRLPADNESNLDGGEGVRPLVLLLTLHLNRQRRIDLLELPQKQNSVYARAGAERAKQHLRGSHPAVLTEQRRLVDRHRVSRTGLDNELHLLPGPAGCRLLHLAQIVGLRG